MEKDRNGKLRSSGCSQSFLAGEGHKIHGDKEHPIYIIWKGMRGKSGYRWNLQLDRKDNDGDYTPSNCGFVTQTENVRNSRITKLSTEEIENIRFGYESEEYTQKELAIMFNVSQGHISEIVNYKYW